VKFVQKLSSPIPSILICIAFFLFSSCSTTRTINANETREEISVKFNDVDEIWRLEWLTKPKEVCAPKNEEAETCPCAGFAYAEYGQADLVRVRDKKEIERFHLDSLFEDEEKPVEEIAAVIQRWPIDDTDYLEVPLSSKSIRKRPTVKVMEVADFNHDGWASEFVLQIGTNSCGHRRAILIGVTPNRPLLHAFGTIKTPNKPLVLEPYAWTLLKRSAHSVRYVAWACGDHAADEQVEIILSAEKTGIRAFQETFARMADFKRGKRIQRKEL
jgi:hypothetical protein